MFSPYFWLNRTLSITFLSNQELKPEGLGYSPIIYTATISCEVKIEAIWDKLSQNFSANKN
jgi:hypothetical protein